MDIKGLFNTKLHQLSIPKVEANLNRQDSSPEEVKKAAAQFEALLLKQMLDAMWKTVPKSEMSSSHEESLYRDMLNQAVADDIAEKQSLGIKDVITKDINRLEGRAEKK